MTWAPRLCSADTVAIFRLPSWPPAVYFSHLTCNIWPIRADLRLTKIPTTKQRDQIHPVISPKTPGTDLCKGLQEGKQGKESR